MDVVNIFNVEFITFLYYKGNIIYQFGAIKMLKTNLIQMKYCFIMSFLKTFQ